MSSLTSQPNIIRYNPNIPFHPPFEADIKTLKIYSGYLELQKVLYNLRKNLDLGRQIPEVLLVESVVDRSRSLTKVIFRYEDDPCKGWTKDLELKLNFAKNSKNRLIPVYYYNDIKCTNSNEAVDLIAKTNQPYSLINFFNFNNSFCICQRPEDEERKYIACSYAKCGCNSWLHPECIGMANENEEDYDKILCLFCAAYLKGSNELDKLYPQNNNNKSVKIIDTMTLGYTKAFVYLNNYEIEESDLPHKVWGVDIEGSSSSSNSFSSTSLNPYIKKIMDKYRYYSPYYKIENQELKKIKLEEDKTSSSSSSNNVNQIETNSSISKKNEKPQVDFSIPIKTSSSRKHHEKIEIQPIPTDILNELETINESTKSIMENPNEILKISKHKLFQSSKKDSNLTISLKVQKHNSREDTKKVHDKKDITVKVSTIKESAPTQKESETTDRNLKNKEVQSIESNTNIEEKQEDVNIEDLILNRLQNLKYKNKNLFTDNLVEPFESYNSAIYNSIKTIRDRNKLTHHYQFNIEYNQEIKEGCLKFNNSNLPHIKIDTFSQMCNEKIVCSFCFSKFTDTKDINSFNINDNYFWVHSNCLFLLQHPPLSANLLSFLNDSMLEESILDLYSKNFRTSSFIHSKKTFQESECCSLCGNGGGILTYFSFDKLIRIDPIHGQNSSQKEKWIAHIPCLRFLLDSNFLIMSSKSQSTPSILNLQLHYQNPTQISIDQNNKKSASIKVEQENDEIDESLIPTFPSVFEQNYNSQNCSACFQSKGIVLKCASFGCNIKLHPICTKFCSNVSIVYVREKSVKKKNKKKIAQPKLATLLCKFHSELKSEAEADSLKE